MALPPEGVGDKSAPPADAGDRATPPAGAGDRATPPAGAGDKAAGAFRTIGELSRETGLPQHILRYWETRFPQLRPLQRAGRRRYYRPDDVALVRRIDTMLHEQGYTIRGVQKLLGTEGKSVRPITDATAVAASIRGVRDMLAKALEQDSA